jgi:hypothetical protein
MKEYNSPVIINKEIEGKENSTEIGTDYEHEKAKDYLIQ